MSKGGSPPPQNQPRHLALKLDASTRTRGEEVLKRLSSNVREATVSETYGMLLLVGLAAAAALEREGRSLKDPTILGPPRKGVGENKRHVAVRVDAPARRQIQETQAKLSSEWRKATLSDAARLLVLLGLEHVETIPGKNLAKNVPALLASLETRARAGRGEAEKGERRGGAS